MVRRFLFILLSLSLSTLAGAESLTVYSHRHYEADDALFAAFTEATGIRVEVVKASADDLIERLRAEGDQSPADLFITADAARLHRAKEQGLLRPIESEWLEERVPLAYRDPAGHWYGFTLRARVLVYAPERVNPEDLRDYESLADPSWRGRLAIRSSAHIYNQSLLASMIAAQGPEAAQRWAEAVRRNLARPPQGSDRDQIRAVAAGLADVAVVNTYYLGLLATSTDARDRRAAGAVKIIFPNQENRGVHVNISGAGVTRASRQPEAATRLLEFLVADQAQSTFPVATYEYPVVPGIPWSELQESWGPFRPDSLPLERLGELNQEAVRTFNRVGWR